MNQSQRAALFAELHVKGTPLTLYNAWDAGSAAAIVDAGAPAIATSSWSVAEAHGYRDGEKMPIDLVQRVIARIVSTVDAPVSADFEGGYSDDINELADHAARFLDLGVVGVNFEDRVVKGTGLHDIGTQAARISAIRGAAQHQKVDLFLNARTDLFLGQSTDPADSVVDAVERAKAYADAGASGFFIPGLQDEALIGRICDAVALPVNVMMMDGVPSVHRLAELGVARISWGPIPYLAAMAALRDAATAVFSS